MMKKMDKTVSADKHAALQKLAKRMKTGASEDDVEPEDSDDSDDSDDSEDYDMECQDEEGPVSTEHTDVEDDDEDPEEKVATPAEKPAAALKQAAAAKGLEHLIAESLSPLQMATMLVKLMSPKK